MTGRLVCSSSETTLDAALGGHGLAWLPIDVVQDHGAAGRLVPVLDDRAATFDGYPACFATRRASPAVMRVLEVLKQTPKAA